jgi:hypothetical protein
LFPFPGGSGVTLSKSVAFLAPPEVPPHDWLCHSPTLPTGVALRDPREQLFDAAERVLLRDGPSALTSRAVTTEAAEAVHKVVATVIAGAVEPRS